MWYPRRGSSPLGLCRCWRYGGGVRMSISRSIRVTSVGQIENTSCFSDLLCLIFHCYRYYVGMPQIKILLLISVRGWVDPTAIVWSEGFYVNEKIQTPAGIEPATFRFVAQHLNHCATAVLQRLPLVLQKMALRWHSLTKICVAKRKLLFPLL